MFSLFSLCSTEHVNYRVVGWCRDLNTYARRFKVSVLNPSEIQLTESHLSWQGLQIVTAHMVGLAPLMAISHLLGDPR